MTCPRNEDDAAFVLGALDPPAMRSFDAHLAGCEACRASVEQLRGLPGLLARLLPGAAEAGAGRIEDTTPTPDVLPVLLRRVRSERRQSRLRVLAVSAAAALLAAAAGATIALSTADAPTTLPVARPGTELALTSSSDSPVEITVFITGRGWGTSIDTRCRHRGAYAEPAPGAAETTYALYAVDRAGADILVSSWTQIPVEEFTVPGSIGLQLTEIRRLELRDDTGAVLLAENL